LSRLMAKATRLWPSTRTITTVLLPNHKLRGTQISCSTLRERRRPVRIGEVLAVVLD
jgi:hypothetical protein